MPKTKIAVVETGAGNLGSLARFIHALGYPMETVKRDPGPRQTKSHICLIPGVGSFGAAMQRVEKNGLRDFIHRSYARGQLIIGICLGAQILLDRSEESPGWKGLGLIPGENRHLSKNPVYKGKCPRIGWQTVIPTPSGKQTPGSFYFMHSFEMIPADKKAIWGKSNDGVNALVGTDNVWGIQPHPEKSQSSGFALLQQIIKKTC